MNNSNQHVILVIDDDPVTAKILELLLRQHQVIIAGTGEDALNKVHKYALSIDLILLDIILPGIDGLEICRMIKLNPEIKHLPIIFLTVKDEPNEEVLCFEAGGIDFIPKPLNASVIKARVKTHLELKDCRDDLERKVEERTREIKERTEEILKLKQDIIDTKKRKDEILEILKKN